MSIIQVNDVYKKFKVYYDKGHTLKDRLLFWSRNKYEERGVLNGISFEVEEGKAVGLVGHNGCGKSTLLKLMTGILEPTSGSIDIKGRVSSLIELGAGFHPDMTGRENIYTNAAIFGLSKKEIDARIDDIIEFSELRDFIENPVRTYSSGMYMRLAFSVAINVEADVLLIDEILAVGDAAFQSKCFDKLMDIKAKGTTIVIVSHSLSQIEQICERSIWIDNGVIRMMGKPNDVHPEYMEFMGNKKKTAVIQDKSKESDKGESKGDDAEKEKEFVAEIVKAELLDSDGNTKENFRAGEEVTLKISYKANPEKIDNALIGLLFYRVDNVQCYGTNTQRERIEFKLNESGEILCHFEKLNLVEGSYWIDIAIRSYDMFAYDYKSRAVRFNVYSSVQEVGIARLEHTWTFN
jgi:ABC-2 type transport system ATP-binding protein